MKRLERTKNSIRNLTWGMVYKVITLLLPFLIRKVIIDVLGKEYLGLNSLFTSILNVLNLAELGLGSAMVYSMYRPIAEENKAEICALLNLYKKLYRLIGTVIFAMGLILLPFLPYLIEGGVEGISIYYIYLIFLINTVLSYLLFAYKSSLLSAHQRTDVSSNIGTIVHLGLNFTQIVLLLVFKNYYIYIVVSPIFTVLNNILINVITKRMYPDYEPTGEISSEARQGIFKQVKALVGHKIGTTVITSADSLVISAFIGLGTLAIYSNYYQIIYFIVGIAGIFFNGMIAGIGNSLITESKEKNYELFESIHFIVNWLVSWCSACLLCLLQPFMTLWMGKDMLLPVSSLIFVVIYYYTWQFRITGLYFKDAAGMWQADFWKPYVAAAVNIIVNIWLVNTIGINGVFLSTIFCMVCINYPWETTVLFKSLFQKSPVPYIMKQLFYILKTVIMCVAAYLICECIPIKDGIICLIVRFIICLIIPNMIFMITSFRAKEADYLKRKVKQIMKQKSL